jgi:hypothetical protein
MRLKFDPRSAPPSLAFSPVHPGTRKKARTRRSGPFQCCSQRSKRLTTSNVRVVDLVTPPPVPVMVMGYVPVGAFLETVKVKSDEPEPGAPMEVGLKLPVTPDGMPVAEKEIAESNPPETLVVTTAYPLCP